MPGGGGPLHPGGGLIPGGGPMPGGGGIPGGGCIPGGGGPGGGGPVDKEKHIVNLRKDNEHHYNIPNQFVVVKAMNKKNVNTDH